MNPIIAIPGLGASETLVVLGIPLLYALPIWLACRRYGPGQYHWRLVAILATLLLSWIGYILVNAIKAGIAGFAEGVKSTEAQISNPTKPSAP